MHIKTQTTDIRLPMESSHHYTLPQSITFMFKDDDWFWKVFLGVIALLLLPLGIGYFFIIGYWVETVRHCRNHETTLPDWNKLGVLWINGRDVGMALGVLSFFAGAVLTVVLGHQNLFAALACVVLTHSFAGPFVILRYLAVPSPTTCFDLRAVFLLMRSAGVHGVKTTGCLFGIFSVVLCFGWMALIVGWPFFIFWGILASASFTASLAPSSGSAEAPAQ